jgi:arginyl-tRNA synthetase
VVRERAIDMMMAEIRNDLAALNVVPEVYFSERSLTQGLLTQGSIDDLFASASSLTVGSASASVPPPKDLVAETIAQLRAQGHIFEGRLPPPKSGVIEDWEDREQTLFRATDFGDDIDRPLMKSDGSYT